MKTVFNIPLTVVDFGVFFNVILKAAKDLERIRKFLQEFKKFRTQLKNLKCPRFVPKYLTQLVT